MAVKGPYFQAAFRRLKRKLDRILPLSQVQLVFRWSDHRSDLVPNIESGQYSFDTTQKDLSAGSLAKQIAVQSENRPCDTSGKVENTFFAFLTCGKQKKL